MTFNTLIILLAVSAAVIAILALLRPHLARVCEEASSHLHKAITVVESALERAIQFLYRAAKKTIDDILPRNPVTGERSASTSHVLIFAFILTIFEIIATYGDVATTIARLSALLGDGSSFTSADLGYLAGLVYVATFGIYAAVWADLNSVGGHTVLFSHKSEEWRNKLCKWVRMGAIVMGLSGIFMVMSATSASQGQPSDITENLFWISFFVGAYYALFLGGLGLISVAGALWAVMLLIGSVPLWAARFLARVIWLVPTGIVWLVKVVFVDILGGIASWIWEHTPGAPKIPSRQTTQSTELPPEEAPDSESRQVDHAGVESNPTSTAAGPQPNPRVIPFTSDSVPRTKRLNRRRALRVN